MTDTGGGEAITREGLEALQAELAQLEGEGRREVAKRILAARELGDLKRTPSTTSPRTTRRTSRRRSSA